MADISQLIIDNTTYNFKDAEGRMQVEIMPTASANLLGKIYQFVGTTGVYTNGFFYKCVPGSTAGTYEWIPVAVQEGGDTPVQSDWNQTDSTADDYIKNKPAIPNNGSQISMTGYSKPSATSAIAPSDTVNTAIGKLEKGLEDAGGGEESNIQVFKSTDFSRFEYIYNSSQTWYAPRVTFNGHSKGKILGIRFINKNKLVPYPYKLEISSRLYHVPNNLFLPNINIINSGSYTYAGITITENLDGMVHVEGTATTTTALDIGYKIGSRYSYASNYEIQNMKWWIKCFGLTGNYGSLSIDGYSSSTSEHSCPVDEVQELYFYNSSANKIYLHIVNGETYNCTFYPTIIPIIENELGDLNHYEKPFAPSYASNPYLTARNARSHPFGSILTDGTRSYINGYGGNSSLFGAIDYPFVHDGLNTFTYVETMSEDASAYDFEVYYVEDASKLSVDESLAEIHDGVVTGRHSGILTYGSFTTPSTGLVSYIEISTIKYSDVVKPTGIWLSYNRTAGIQYIADSGTIASYTDMRDVQYNDIYIPSSQFQWADNTKYLRLPLKNSLTAGKTYYYTAIHDYDGFDDSTDVT